GLYEEFVAYFEHSPGIKVSRYASTETNSNSTSEESISLVGRAHVASHVVSLNFLDLAPNGLTIHVTVISTETEKIVYEHLLCVDPADPRPFVQETIREIISCLNFTLRHQPFELVESSRLNADQYEKYLRSLGLSMTNRRSDFELALQFIMDLHRDNPSNPDILGHYAFMLWRSYFAGWGGNYTSLSIAKELALKALQINLRCNTAKMALVRLYWDSGEYKEAVNLGFDAMNDRLSSSEGILTLVRALLNAGHAILAQEFLEKAFAYDPQNITGLKLEIWIALVLKKYSKAISLYTQYNSRIYGDTNTVWAAVMAYIHLNRLDDAITTAHLSLNQEPANPILLTLLGFIHRLNEDLASATSTWEQSLTTLDASLKGINNNYRLATWRCMNLALIGEENKCQEELSLII
ncbi:MAG: hypothetical protein KDD62_15755, partial [Bdellovibrionales bacterium]|nr:hypothetical protein [Bdellovibrionales bacterium]